MCEINVGTRRSHNFIFSTNLGMISLAFSEEFFLFGLSNSKTYRLSNINFINTSIQSKPSCIKWTKTYVSPRWGLFWWPYDLSSSVAIYLEFHLDQLVDLQCHKMSCLWRVSQRMTLITFWVPTDLSASTTISHHFPRIDRKSNGKIVMKYTGFILHP